MMYQKLRKFINVIVSSLIADSFRMNCVTSASTK